MPDLDTQTLYFFLKNIPDLVTEALLDREFIVVAANYLRAIFPRSI